MFTTLYSVKVLYLTFLTNPNGPLINYKQAHEGDIFMSLPAGWCGRSLAWVKLSNSGDLLKLLVPSSCWKTICGWTNYSEMVTSQKMIEKEMDNRGSKSDSYTSVKEQRVDGSWYKKNSFVFKVYSNGYRKILSSQNPFLANIYTGFSRSMYWYYYSIY